MLERNSKFVETICNELFPLFFETVPSASANPLNHLTILEIS